jgi:hypothetical protein
MLKKIMQLSSYLLPDVPHFPSLIKIATEFGDHDQNVRARASKLIKELSEVSLVDPLSAVNPEEFTLQTTYTKKDFSQYFMKSLNFFVKHPIGIPSIN